MKRTLPPESLREITTRLEPAHAAFQRRYPGSSGARQPVHVVYGGAHLFRADTARRLGELALRSLDDYAPDFVTFARAIALPGAERLPDLPDAAAAISKSIEADQEGAKKENRPVWFAHTLYRRVREKLRRDHGGRSAVAQRSDARRAPFRVVREDPGRPQSQIALLIIPSGE